MIFASSMKVTPVFWWQKVRFSDLVFVVLLTPLKLTQYLRPPSDLVQGAMQKLLIVELILMEM